MKKLLTLALVAGLAPLAFADSGQGGYPNGYGDSSCCNCPFCATVGVDVDLVACPTYCVTCPANYGSWCAPPIVPVVLGIDPNDGHVIHDASVEACGQAPLDARGKFDITKVSPFDVTLPVAQGPDNVTFTADAATFNALHVWGMDPTTTGKRTFWLSGTLNIPTGARNDQFYCLTQLINITLQ